MWMHPGYVSFCKKKSLNNLTLTQGSFFPAFSMSADFLKMNSKIQGYLSNCMDPD